MSYLWATVGGCTGGIGARPSLSGAKISRPISQPPDSSSSSSSSGAPASVPASASASASASVSASASATGSLPRVRRTRRKRADGPTDAQTDRQLHGSGGAPLARRIWKAASARLARLFWGPHQNSGCSNGETCAHWLASIPVRLEWKWKWKWAGEELATRGQDCYRQSAFASNFSIARRRPHVVALLAVAALQSGGERQSLAGSAWSARSLHSHSHSHALHSAQRRLSSALQTRASLLAGGPFQSGRSKRIFRSDLRPDENGAPPQSRHSLATGRQLGANKEIQLLGSYLPL